MRAGGGSGGGSGSGEDRGGVGFKLGLMEVPQHSANLHELWRQVLLQKLLDSHIGMAPGAAVHLPEGANANAGSQLQLLCLNLPLIRLNGPRELHMAEALAAAGAVLWNEVD